MIVAKNVCVIVCLARMEVCVKMFLAPSFSVFVNQTFQVRFCYFGIILIFKSEQKVVEEISQDFKKSVLFIKSSLICSLIQFFLIKNLNVFLKNRDTSYFTTISPKIFAIPHTWLSILLHSISSMHVSHFQKLKIFSHAQPDVVSIKVLVNLDISML